MNLSRDHEISDTLQNRKVISLSELFLLGAPAGNDDSIKLAIAEKIDMVDHFCQCIANLSAHENFFLLKHCLFVPIEGRRLNIFA